MTDTAQFDLDHLREWIGRQDIAEDVLTTDLARKFHATFDRPGEPPVSGDAAPPLIHFCLAQPAVATADLGGDGHPRRGGFLPPVPLPRRMWAGGEITFHDALRVGELATRVSRVADVTAKQGRSGVLCFVTVEHVIDSGGRTVLRERQDIVYRGAGGNAPGPAAAAPAAEAGEHSRTIDPSPPLLFRYSALTFNGHRIHYDGDYARNVESYPGLVVHGPLQATLLINLATDIHGRPPSRFAFRAQSPVFAGSPLLLHACERDGKLQLWTAGENGPVAMSAEAEWG